MWEALDWSPRIVLALVEDLIYAPNGAFAASLQGGPEFRGWNKDRHMLAELWDATVAGIYVAGQSKKKPPTYPRPTKKQQNRGLGGLMAAIPRGGA